MITRARNCSAPSFAAAYRDARKETKAETGLPWSAFATEPPLTLAELEDEGFLPNGRS